MGDQLYAGQKEILHSKRANIYYLEHCRVMVKGGRVVFLTPAEGENQYWNIPIANTTVILLGTGTSLTQAAVRMLCAAGVMLGFSGGGGTPLLAATEIEWLSPQSEYRPTEYLQSWMSFWFDAQKRLSIARFLLSIYGGKLTAYRITAQRVMQQLSASLPRPSRHLDTKQIILGR